MESKILFVTHDGTVHSDERVACTLLWAHIISNCGEHVPELQIVRTRDLKAYEPYELKKAFKYTEVYFVDVGDVYDRKTRFDHHQSSPAVEGHCAATLVAQVFHPDLLHDHPFGNVLRRIAVQDTRGLSAVAEEYGNRDVVPFLHEEFEANNRFEMDPVGEVFNSVGGILRMKAEVQAYQKLRKWASDRLVGYDTYFGTVLVWDRDATEFLKKHWHDGLVRRYNAERIEESDAIAMVSFESSNSVEGVVYRFYRTGKGEKILDFNKWRGHPEIGEIKFCHKSGFLLLIRDYKPVWKEGIPSWMEVIKNSAGV